MSCWPWVDDHDDAAAVVAIEHECMGARDILVPSGWGTRALQGLIVMLSIFSFIGGVEDLSRVLVSELGARL